MGTNGKELEMCSLGSPNDLLEEVESLIRRSERRIMIKVQVISILTVLFFSFLIYVLYFMIKVTNSMTSDLAQWHIKEVERINVLEKAINMSDR